MMKEARTLAMIADNICIKVPLTLDGLKACRAIRADGRMVNVTLCFSANQALLAAKAGASFISPFIGRIDDAGSDGMELISEIRTIYDNYDFQTEILAASIRTVNHVKQAALIGADVATVPPDDQASTPALFLAGKGNITRDFTPAIAEPAGLPDGAVALKLTPVKAEREYETLVLVVDRATLQWRQLATTDRQGGRSMFVFSNLRENTGVPDREFVFSIPRGVDVITDGGR